MTKQKLASIIESILYVSGKEVEVNAIISKFEITTAEFNDAVKLLKEKYNKDCGINIIEFNRKLQFCSNPQNVNEVAEVLNPIREKELTKAMLETLAIIAYKQPVTRLEIEEIRGVDCTYALQTLSKMAMVQMVGRKDAIGKPILFGTTDEFLKRFSLKEVDELPDYETLLERIQTMAKPTSNNLYDSNRDVDFTIDEDIPEFLKDEKIIKID